MEEKNRQEEIHRKGFQVDFGKIKINNLPVDQTSLQLDSFQKAVKTYFSKGQIYRAILEGDIATQREISNYFFKINGIYNRACNLFANMYRYDWYLSSEIYDKEKANVDKIKKDFQNTLKYLDNSYISKVFTEIARSTVVNGAYYGYIVENPKRLILQELPIKYCRSRYNINNLPAVEFNMKFFDVAFPNTAYRQQILNKFPDEFKKGYYAYKQDKLRSEGFCESENGWWLLDPTKAFKFSFGNGSNGMADIPLFISAIPAIMDLEEAQDLDRRKQMQKLLKIIVQKLPRDKNGDLIFDIDEAKDLHNIAVEMLKQAVGVDVLTTFADIDAIDLSDKATATSTDDLEKVERSVYNALGISQNLFNTAGNLSLEKSILNDESMCRNLLFQFEQFLDTLVRNQTKKKEYSFRFYFLDTTQFNYKDLSRLYKEQSQLGFPRLYTQIALGHSQSSILNMIDFENNVLNLSETMIPPLMSSTLSMEDLKGRNDKSNSNNSQEITEDKTVGRPKKEESEKSEKTIQNLESMN